MSRNSSNSHSQSHSSHSHNSRETPPPPSYTVLPPMRYKLTKLTQGQTLAQIASKTQGFYEMSVNSADWIQQDVRSREFSSYGSYPAPYDSYIVNTIVGKDNYYLKMTMKKHDMDYICHDSLNNVFQFWGEYQCCIRAMNEIRHRVHVIEERTKREEREKKYMEKKRVEEEKKILEEKYPVSSGYSKSSWVAGDEDDDTDLSNNGILFSYIEPTIVVDNASYNVDASYSLVAKKQMEKMGYVTGKGLGAVNAGRLLPLKPVEDLGGRDYNANIGVGYIEYMNEASLEEDDDPSLDEIAERLEVEYR
jgi:hypothetical protein